ncbi:MAG: division/cell wall cluster transcriptional repressor MraZ [Candidatus Omnitrophota bacterium]|nr:division/cell wall cluster transcriptional repressor MraZ [Candidatus Omnitrophota bacterium]
MFYGEYLHKLDKKNRLIIPSKFRESVTEMCIEKFYLTRGLDECIFMFSEGEWKTQESRFKAMSFTKEKARKFQRQFFGGAFEVAPDKQWRILVPDILKEYAGLSKIIMIVGVSSRIEIWDRDKWQEYSVSSKEEYGEIAEGLVEF